MKFLAHVTVETSSYTEAAKVERYNELSVQYNHLTDNESEEFDRLSTDLLGDKPLIFTENATVTLWRDPKVEQPKDGRRYLVSDGYVTWTATYRKATDYWDDDARYWERYPTRYATLPKPEV